MAQNTSCCVVGGGPAGVVLAYLLAKEGIHTTLLESHKDFDRDFRGDTFHATSMQLVEDLGLLSKIEPHIRSRLGELGFTTASGRHLVMADFKRLPTRFPYVAIISQVDFLNVMVEEAKKFPSFRLVMQATAQELLEEQGKVVGVRYQHEGEGQELRANLVVGADGRGSRMRSKAGFTLETSAPPMDVIWFRMDRDPSKEASKGFDIAISKGKMMVQVARGDSWQFGLVVLKGSGHELREAGLEAFQEMIRPMLPEQVQNRVGEIDSWSKTTVLAVQVGRVPRWYRPGLLLIGDAAHVMSPIGGVGINYAVQDAIAAYNLLRRPLKTGNVTEEDLAAVQARREFPTKVIQKIQTLAQETIVKKALQSDGEFEFPLPLRILSKTPILRDLPGRIFGFGLRPERIER